MVWLGCGRLQQANGLLSRGREAPLLTIDHPITTSRSADESQGFATPTVSVIIPVYNGSATLGRALKSVAAQHYPSIQVIVVDDGSSDDIAAVVASARDLDIRLERLPVRSGVSAARNRGLELARGEFIAFLDADDEWLPEKLARQVETLTNDRSIAFSHCETLLVSGDHAELHSEAAHACAHGPEAWRTLLKCACVVTSGVVTRRSLLERVGGFDPALVIGEDQDLWIRLALAGPVHHEEAPLVRKYDTPGSLCNTHGNLVAAMTLPMVERHLAAVAHQLTAKERREILLHRRLMAGRRSYESGDLARGAALLISTVLHGHQPISTLNYLVTASPAARAMKRMIGWSRAY